jgi:TolB-like protein/thioredoxin-like negative regulator of GroEL
MKLFSELKRRNVLRMAALYIVAAWLIMQVAGVLIDLGNLPGWAGPIILPLLVVGFPIAIALSWFYEITPEGVSREKDVEPGEVATQLAGRRLDFIVISLLCAAVLLFAYDKWWIGPPPEKSIAVLPFTNLSGDPDQEYFSDGISEELLHLLAQLPDVRVPARTSSFYFKGRNEPVADIAAALNVAHVLEGSIRRSGDRIRITAQLIKADDGYHVWSQTYDREIGDIFAIQDEIAANISDSLELKLALVGGEPVQPSVVKAASTDAYDAYLKGRELIRLRGRENIEAAVGHLEHALRLDNDFAPAHAKLAYAIALLHRSDLSYGMLTSAEVKRRATPHLERAMELQPELAEAHAARALVESVVSGPESAIEHARKALVLNPSDTEAMNQLYIVLGQLGRYGEADAVLKQMVDIDPLTIIGRFNYAHYLGAVGRVDEAHEIADQLAADSRRMGLWVHTEISYLYDDDIIDTLSWGLQVPDQNGYVMARFIDIGEYDEARRFVDTMAPWIDIAEGRFNEVIEAMQAELGSNPDNRDAGEFLERALYFSDRVEEAWPLLERKLEAVPEGRLIPGDFSRVQSMRLALARRVVDDEDGAQALAEIVRRDIDALRAAGRQHGEIRLAEAMLAAFVHDADRAIDELESAIQSGTLASMIFYDPVFEAISNEPRFVALHQKHKDKLAQDREKALQLICFSNPAPDEWQPLPETCDGIVEQP